MTKFPRVMRRLVSVAALVIISSWAGQAQDVSEAVKRWESFDFAKNKIVTSQITNLPLEDLQLLRGIIFGRHGRVFKDLAIKAYLTERPWYHANPDFNNSNSMRFFRKRILIDRDAEAGKHRFCAAGRYALLALALWPGGNSGA